MTKLTKIAAGHYEATINGKSVTVKNAWPVRRGWFAVVEGEGLDQNFTTKREATEAAIWETKRA